MDDSFTGFLFFAETGGAIEPVTWTSAAIKAILVLGLVALNGFFVAAEFAFVSVRRTRIETLADEGNNSAKRLLEILSNLNPYLSAFQLGITLASLALGALGEPLVEAVLGSSLNAIPENYRHFVSYGIAFLVITTFHIVLGEQAPKLFGLAVAEKVALYTALPMQLFYKVFKPFIHTLDWASVKAVQLFGIKAQNEHGDSIYTEDEIRQLVKASQESGHLNEEERRLINQVFEFSDTTVREAMIPRTEIVAIPAVSTLEEIAKAFREHGYSRMPVYGDSLDDMRGVLHSKDVMQYLLVKPRMFKLERVLKKPYYVVDTARLEDVLRQMQREKFHFGFVVDEHGGVEGIITLEDLLEEIVGDISDEHDEEVNEQIKAEPDGSFTLDGGLAVRDLNKRCGMNLPVSDAYTTVAGFLMAESGQILTEGETVPFNGHIFKIERVEKRRILRVRMEKVDKDEVV